MTPRKEIPKQKKNKKLAEEEITILAHFAQLLRCIGGGNLSDSGQVVGHVGKVTLTVACKEIVEGRDFFMIQVRGMV